MIATDDNCWPPATESTLNDSAIVQSLPSGNAGENEKEADNLGQKLYWSVLMAAHGGQGAPGRVLPS